jgi:transposase
MPISPRFAVVPKAFSSVTRDTRSVRSATSCPSPVTRDTVASGFKAWESEGLEGLRDKARSGRPPIYDDQDHERLQELVKETPHQIKTVRARLHEETGKTASTATLKRALKKSAIVSSASGAH